MDRNIEIATQSTARKGPARRNSALIQGYLRSADYRTPATAPNLRPNLAFAGAIAAAVAVVAWVGAAAPALAAFGG